MDFTQSQNNPCIYEKFYIGVNWAEPTTRLTREYTITNHKGFRPTQLTHHINRLLRALIITY